MASPSASASSSRSSPVAKQPGSSTTCPQRTLSSSLISTVNVMVRLRSEPLTPHRHEAGSFEGGDCLLAGDTPGQPTGHAGTRTSNEVTSGGDGAEGAGSS